jgi:hypothetical protein
MQRWLNGLVASAEAGAAVPIAAAAIAVPRKNFVIVGYPLPTLTASWICVRSVIDLFTI